ncbi:MAG: histidinol-phosphatase [Clostridium sp.]|nr:histidinol-phosphatase [Clostridium sp.]
MSQPIDFESIARTTDRYNFHSHTQFCDGRASMEEFAEAACREGFLHYGFTPHSPLCPGVDSPCNMSFDDVPAYMAEVRRLRDIYRGRVELYAGMEIDFLGDDWGPATPWFDTIGLDYRIGSVHFIPSDSGFVDIDGRFESFRRKMEQYFANDIRHVVETFYRQTTRMVELGGLDLLGHFDKIGYNASQFRPGIEDEPWYVCLVDDLIDLMIDRRQKFEINTKALAEHGRVFPLRRWMPRLTAAGIPFVVNSDAHYPNRINSGRPETLRHLQNLPAQ